MNIFLTGATGYVGSRILRRLLAAGHRVTALCRSIVSQRKAEQVGATGWIGHLAVPDSFVASAARADAIIHAGFHYHASGQEDAATDRRATLAMLAAQRGADHPKGFVYTSSIFLLSAHIAPTLSDDMSYTARGWRLELEQDVLAHAHSASSVVRPGWVFGDGAGTLLEAFRPDHMGAIPYPADGGNRLPLVHVHDLADLYARIVESQATGVFHGVELAARTRNVSRAIAAAVRAPATISVPPEALPHAFSSAASLVNLDLPATADRSRALGWLANRAPRDLAESLQEKNARDPADAARTDFPAPL